MRFLVDECTGPTVARWLLDQGHEVFSVYDQARGLEDDTLIQKAFQEVWVLITNDKDFGEMIFRQGLPHHGVIFLRLDDERAASKIITLAKLLTEYADRIENHFVVVNEDNVRISQG